MSRRRRSEGFFSRIFEGVNYLGQMIVNGLLWPFYVVADIYDSLVGGSTPGLRSRTWRDFFVDVLLFVPRLIGFVFMWLYGGIVSWPRMIRLRDLASGLPALIGTVAAVAVLFFAQKDDAHVVQGYKFNSDESYAKAQQEPTEEARKAALKLAQFYTRALVKMNPLEPEYRFNVAYIYQEMGEFSRAQSIMDDLAPRYESGFAKAHLWQADQLLAPDRPIRPDSLDAAEAHLLRALTTYSDKEAIHRRLGELYYFRYLRYDPKSFDVRMPARNEYLRKSEEQLSKVAALDPKMALSLAEIRALEGKTQQAELDVQGVVTQLTTRLSSVPDDLETRIQLARAYRMVRRYADAANVLREGQNLRPDIRFDQELSGIYYFQALDIKQRTPAALVDQFAALQHAYVSYPSNNYVTHRFVQALTSGTSEEADVARSALQHLVDNKAPGRMATFLLGFDCLQRKLPVKAGEFFAKAQSMPVDNTPEVIAGLTMAVLTQQVRSLNPPLAGKIFEAGLKVWPDDPDLLSVRAQQDLMLRNYPKALGDLKKALERRPHDAKLHEMIATTYERLGLVDQCREHRLKANESRQNAAPPPP